MPRFSCFVLLFATSNLGHTLPLPFTYRIVNTLQFPFEMTNQNDINDR